MSCLNGQDMIQRTSNVWIIRSSRWRNISISSRCLSSISTYGGGGITPEDAPLRRVGPTLKWVALCLRKVAPMRAIIWTGSPVGKSFRTKKQQNPMNENRIDKSMSYNRTPMNFVQRTKKQMRKTNRRTKNKIVQKHTSLKRDGVEMRDRPQRMTCYPKEKISSLRKLSRRDPKISTPLDRRPSDVWYDVI